MKLASNVASLRLIKFSETDLWAVCGDVLDQFVSFLVQHKVGDLPNTNVAVAPNERTKTKPNQEPAEQPRCSRHVAYNAWSLQVVCRSLEYRVQVVCLVHGARLQVKVSEVLY